MALAEFELIRTCFTGIGPARADTALGVGDDAAVLSIYAGQEVVQAAAHRCADSARGDLPEPRALAHQTLAEALTRLAACAAEPAWATLALTLPAAQAAWIRSFAESLGELARAHGVQLVGGDTTCGPLAVSIHVLGVVPRGAAPRPDAARPGDLVYVTGRLGDAGLALLALRNELRLPVRVRDALIRSLERPVPPVRAGLALRGLASAAAPVTDGLAAALEGLLGASRAGATLQAERLPVSATLRDVLAPAGGWALPLTAPGEHELCFTLPPHRQVELEGRFAAAGRDVSWIGVVERTPGLRCTGAGGQPLGPG
jgi:thiamine-monophosphate kinase